MAAWKTQQTQPTKRIQVKQQDANAHHVLDTQNKINAYAIFKATTLKSENSPLHSTNHSSIVLIRQSSSEKIELSHTNINIDDIGKQSAESIITLKGKWALDSKDTTACKATIQGETTTLKFSNKMAQTQQITLTSK